MVDIHALVIIGGRMPPRALGMIVEWGAQHRKELLDLWELAANGQSLYKLPPLEWGTIAASIQDSIEPCFEAIEDDWSSEARPVVKEVEL